MIWLLAGGAAVTLACVAALLILAAGGEGRPLGRARRRE
jgi:hypothetical protein